jgi:hypothetical protein
MVMGREGIIGVDNERIVTLRVTLLIMMIGEEIDVILIITAHMRVSNIMATIGG